MGGIPSDVAKELGITIIPINVLFGTEVYRDGVDLTTDQFYDKLVQTKIFPTTAVPPLGDFVKIYDQLAEETDEILVITISSKLSGTCAAAQQAVELMKKKCRVEVIDSRFVIMAEGLIVITAAKAAQAGASFDEVVKITQSSNDTVPDNQIKGWVELKGVRLPVLVPPSPIYDQGVPLLSYTNGSFAYPCAIITDNNIILIAVF